VRRGSATGAAPTSSPAECVLLAGLSPGVLAKRCPSAAVVALRHKTVLYSQGRHCRHLFCLCEGQVKLSRVDQEGNELTIGLLSAGELFGPWLADSQEGEAQETATTKGPLAVWRVPADEFHALLLATPWLSLRVIETLARRQRQLERRLACFAFQRTDRRLAETLRELSGGFDRRCEHGFGQHLRITQQELADLVGATRPVVSTLLNRLRDQGVLGYSRDYLCVRNIERIERLLGE
jgi:CRP/FNR family transcriptional regulator, cyclic AMP receptor protein